MRVSALFFVAAPVAVLASAAEFAPHANMRRLAFPQANNGNGNSSTITTSTHSTSTGSTSVSSITTTGSGSSTASTTGSGSSTGSGSTSGSATATDTTGATTATTTNSRKMSTFVTVIEPTRSGEQPVTSTMVVVADETGSTETGSSESASSSANPSTQVGAAAGLAESVSKWTLAALAGAVAFGIAA